MTPHLGVPEAPNMSSGIVPDDEPMLITTPLFLSIIWGKT
jgi:hypothetical protein